MLLLASRTIMVTKAVRHQEGQAALAYHLITGDRLLRVLVPIFSKVSTRSFTLASHPHHCHRRGAYHLLTWYCQIKPWLSHFDYYFL